MRYYFDVNDGEEELRDELGYECTRNELREHAVAVLPDIARDRLPDGDSRTMTVRVRDEHGRYVFEAALAFEARWLD